LAEKLLDSNVKVPDIEKIIKRKEGSYQLFLFPRNSTIQKIPKQLGELGGTLKTTDKFQRGRSYLKSPLKGDKKAKKKKKKKKTREKGKRERWPFQPIPDQRMRSREK